MAASSGGRRTATKAKNSARAALMKWLGIERTTQRCPNCYRIVSCDSSKSRYTHICKG